jgi:hypothetical protein
MVREFGLDIGGGQFIVGQVRGNWLLVPQF